MSFRGEQFPFPEAGALRVAPDPTRLPLKPPPGEPGHNRFDDPHCEYVVRYLATDLRGCMIELLARFRKHDAVEERLASVTGTEERYLPPEETTREGLKAYLAKQHVGCGHVDRTPNKFINVNDPEFLSDLNGEPGVRDALAALANPDEELELDEGTIRLGGDQGRRITRAVSRSVFDSNPRPDGLRYCSRLDDAEECWAVFEDVPFRFEPNITVLSPDDQEHGEAVQSAALLFHITLPVEWS